MKPRPFFRLVIEQYRWFSRVPRITRRDVWLNTIQSAYEQWRLAHPHPIDTTIYTPRKHSTR